MEPLPPNPSPLYAAGSDPSATGTLAVASVAALFGALVGAVL